MHPFTLERPRDLAAALALGAQAGRTDAPVEYIAGGSDMVQLLQEDPSISLIVLGTARSASNPGPLVTYMLANLWRRVRVPVTLVPGELTVEEIDALT